MIEKEPEKMKKQLESIVTKLHGVSGLLAVINIVAGDSEFADAIFSTRDYLETVIEELAAISEQQ